MNLLEDQYMRGLVGKAISEGRYVIFHGIRSEKIDEKSDLETPYIIACTEEQGLAIFNEDRFEGRLYDVEGAADVTGTLSGIGVALTLPSRREKYFAVSEIPFQFEGQWEGRKSKGRWTLELVMGED